MAATIKDIYEFVDSFAPYNTQCEWDNSGIIIGSKTDTVNKIGLSLDLTPEVLEDAIEKKCDLIFTHHPAIFFPIKNIEPTSVIYRAIQNNINVICAHTNYDKCPTGVNYLLAKKVSVKSPKKLDSVTDASMCQIGEIEPKSPEEFAKIISDNLNVPIKYVNAQKAIKTVAVCGGAGGEFLFEAKANGADAFVTGEVKYHEYLAAKELDMSIYCAGHYETECIVMESLKTLLENKFNVECVLLNQPNPTDYTGV